MVRKLAPRKAGLRQDLVHRRTRRIRSRNFGPSFTPSSRKATAETARGGARHRTGSGPRLGRGGRRSARPQRHRQTGRRCFRQTAEGERHDPDARRSSSSSATAALSRTSSNLTPEEKAWGNPEVIASLDVTKLPADKVPDRIKNAIANPQAVLDRHPEDLRRRAQEPEDAPGRRRHDRGRHRRRQHRHHSRPGDLS